MSSRLTITALLLGILFVPLLPAVCTVAGSCPMAELMGARMAMPEPCHGEVQISDGCCCLVPSAEPPAALQAAIPTLGLELAPRPVSVEPASSTEPLPAQPPTHSPLRSLDLLTRLQTFLI